MVAISGAIAGLGTIISAALRFSENGMVAYFLVLSFVLVDSGIAGFLNIQGATGTFFTVVFQSLGVPIIWYSWYVLILVALYPFIKNAFFW